MRINLLIILTCVFLNKARTQGHGGIEQYYYTGPGGSTLVPKIFYENNKKWYGEARYNYEELRTFSFIAGKVFSKKDALSYSFTPVAGVVIGKFNGGLLGLKTEMNYKKLFFSSESQYSFSVENRNKDFFYSWSDLGYQVRSWMYAGVAMQLIIARETNESIEPGIVVGFSIKKWTFPVYMFNTTNHNRYVVLGISYELGPIKNKAEEKK